MTAPRAYTTDELRDALLEQIADVARYWATLPEVDSATGRKQTVLSRCNGVAFSILTILDGCTLGLPPVDLVFQPHDSDQEYQKENGENWVEPGTVVSTMLHEHFYKFAKD